MDMIKRAKDRMEQQVFETVGSTPKTTIDAAFLGKIARVEELKQQVERLLHAVERHIPHDARLIAAFTQATHPADNVASAFRSFSAAASQWPSDEANDHFHRVFEAGEATYRMLSRCEKEFVEKSAINFLSPMKTFEQFLASDMKRFEQEKRLLFSCRVDMDSARNRAGKDGSSVRSAALSADADAATHGFLRQVEQVRDELVAIERKLWIIHDALNSHLKTYSAFLRHSLHSVDALRSVMDAAPSVEPYVPLPTFDLPLLSRPRQTLNSVEYPEIATLQVTEVVETTPLALPESPAVSDEPTSSPNPEQNTPVVATTSPQISDNTVATSEIHLD